MTFVIYCVILTMLGFDMDLKLNTLKHLIDTGACPDIEEYTSDSNKYSCEDLVDLEYGTTQRIYMGGALFETWFTYTGPRSVKINDLILEEGDMIESYILEVMHE